MPLGSDVASTLALRVAGVVLLELEIVSQEAPCTAAVIVACVLAIMLIGIVAGLLPPVIKAKLTFDGFAARTVGGETTN